MKCLAQCTDRNFLFDRGAMSALQPAAKEQSMQSEHLGRKGMSSAAITGYLTSRDRML